MRQAIKTAEITAIRKRYAQIANRPIVGIPKHHPQITRKSVNCLFGFWLGLLSCVSRYLVEISAENSKTDH